MAAKRSGGPQGQVKGFRPGKEPPHLRKQVAKARLGKDASWAQKRTVDALAGQSPDDVRKTVGRWSTGLFGGALLLGVGGVFLYGWTVPAGVVAHLLAAALGFLGYRLRKQGEALAEMARSL